MALAAVQHGRQAAALLQQSLRTCRAMPQAGRRFCSKASNTNAGGQDLFFERIGHVINRPIDGACSRFWAWTTRSRPSWRESKVEAAVAFCVFGITGSSSVRLMKPVMKGVGLEGNMKDGPWSYRFGSLAIVTPVYPLVLVTVGTIWGRHNYFAAMARHIYRRMTPLSCHAKLGILEPAPKVTVPRCVVPKDKLACPVPTVKEIVKGATTVQPLAQAAAIAH